MWINRNIENYIIKLSKNYPSIFLTGARQVGKTSLLRKLFSDFQYISFDLPSKAERAEKNPELFFSDIKSNIILDEVQYVPSIFRYLKYQIDNFKDKKKFILTGSQNLLLMKNISESLSGRCAIINLYTLSYFEIIQNKNYSNIDYIDFIIKGGYPFLWVYENQESDIFYSSYLVTYLERDVRNISNVGRLRDFERFVRAISIRAGQILNYSDIARDIGIAVSTAKEWISILEASNIIYLMEPYYKNIGKRLIKSPKIYFTDTGFLCYLLGIQNRNDFYKSIYSGNVWENYIISEVLRFFSFKGLKPTIWYLRDKDGLEVDLIIELNGKTNIFEIKFTEKPDINDIKGIKKIIKSLNFASINKFGVICRTFDEYEIDKNIFAYKPEILNKLSSE